MWGVGRWGRGKGGGGGRLGDGGVWGQGGVAEKFLDLGVAFWMSLCYNYWHFAAGCVSGGAGLGGLAFARCVPLLLLSWMAGVRLRGGGLGVFVRCAGAFLAFTFEVCRGFVLPLLGLVKVRGCDGRRGLVSWGRRRAAKFALKMGV